MILKRTQITMNEVEKILASIPDSEKKQEIELFLKKFMKAKAGQAQKIKKDILKLDIAKLKDEHVIKIIDILPEDASDLNKIFSDVSLNEDEINSILYVVKNSE